MASQEEMDQWAKTFKDGLFKRFIGSPSLEVFYAKHNVPTLIENVVSDQNAKLTVMISNKFKPRTMTLCKQCNRKVCDKEKCGADDYDDMLSFAYGAADRTGVITLRVAPWDQENVGTLKEEEVYVVAGKANTWKDKLYLDVKEAAKADDSVEMAEPKRKEEKSEPEKKELTAEQKEEMKKQTREALKEALEMFDGEIPQKKWDNNLKPDGIPDWIQNRIMAEEGVALIDGKYEVVKK